MGSASLTHGVTQARQRELLVRGVRVAAAITAIDLLLGVQEQGRPGHVVIKVEDVQVYAAHIEDADQNKIPGQSCKLFVQTNNLLVKRIGVGSVVSPKDDEQWLIFSGCNFSCLLVIRVPQRLRFLRAENGSEGKEHDDAETRFHAVAYPIKASGGRQPPVFVATNGIKGLTLPELRPLFCPAR
jgi:hypothetical protein